MYVYLFSELLSEFSQDSQKTQTRENHMVVDTNILLIEFNDTPT